MRFNFKSLLLWFLIYHFLIESGINSFVRSGKMDPISLTDTAFSFTSPFAFFLYWLFCYIVLYKFYPTRKWVHIILGLILSLILPGLFRYLVEQKLSYYLFDITNYRREVSLSFYIREQYLYGISYITPAAIYYFVRYSLFNKKRERELILENEKMKLSALRSQVNPHFLLNSLNNIQSLAYMKSDKVLPAIEQLSDLLKYTLYQDAEWTTFENELDLVKKYIALEKIRYAYDFEMRMDIDQEVMHVSIPPYVLLPLFENAFKHADLKSKSHPFTISIKPTSQGIQIHSSNKIGTHSKDNSGGVGLSNLRKRLELIFENKASLKITKKELVFSIDILIPTR